MKTEKETLATLVEQGKWIMKEIHELKIDVKELNKWKWKTVGMGIMLGSIGAFLLEFIKDGMHK